jgi:hypothetical protein
MSALRKSYIMVIKLSKFCLKSNTWWQSRFIIRSLISEQKYRARNSKTSTSLHVFLFVKFAHLYLWKAFCII